jgi:hypothetical protein
MFTKMRAIILALSLTLGEAVSISAQSHRPAVPTQGVTIPTETDKDVACPDPDVRAQRQQELLRSVRMERIASASTARGGALIIE